MLQLNISADLTLPDGRIISFIIRENPSLDSLGEVSITPEGDKVRIQSFFDIFTELSLDEGLTWTPATNEQGEIVPSPLLLCSIPSPLNPRLLSL